MSGGFKETLVNELMVIPTGSPDELLQVVTVMPVGYRAHTRRNSSELMISARVSISFRSAFRAFCGVAIARHFWERLCSSNRTKGLYEYRNIIRHGGLEAYKSFR